MKFCKKDNDKQIIKQQSKLNFNGTHISNTNNDSYTIQQKELPIDKPAYLGFAVLEMSKLFTFET